MLQSMPVVWTAWLCVHDVVCKCQVKRIITSLRLPVLLLLIQRRTLSAFFTTGTCCWLMATVLPNRPPQGFSAELPKDFPRAGLCIFPVHKATMGQALWGLLGKVATHTFLLSKAWQSYCFHYDILVSNYSNKAGSLAKPNWLSHHAREGTQLQGMPQRRKGPGADRHCPTKTSIFCQSPQGNDVMMFPGGRPLLNN